MNVQAGKKNKKNTLHGFYFLDKMSAGLMSYIHTLYT